MKSSHPSLICILFLSLFHLHQCVRIQRSENIDETICVLGECDNDLGCFYCCPNTPLCLGNQQYCNTFCQTQN
ncbi:hypothetical protein EUTSA_v10009267mg [Eutrema salsugineum]|uniref:Embryo surrounding factor 1 brassicaceae domain-containing protein n=1 Tax=Eutrema salsugineum TaxID=72664 RepID=V4KDH2_EUTSA|nr:EMBRYO SURROUNDING FACTOR 1-like protein 4 [Eutrema salsugineum]ESQ35775.1 hypothetical protein EUTSA_v10009267mg [Eutrema salsugineum]